MLVSNGTGQRESTLNDLSSQVVNVINGLVGVFEIVNDSGGMGDFFATFRYNDGVGGSYTNIFQNERVNFGETRYITYVLPANFVIQEYQLIIDTGIASFFRNTEYPDNGMFNVSLYLDKITFNIGRLQFHYLEIGIVTPSSSNTGFNGFITINHAGSAYQMYIVVRADGTERYNQSPTSFTTTTFSIGTQLLSASSYLYMYVEPAGSYAKSSSGFVDEAVVFVGYETIGGTYYEKYSISSTLTNATLVYNIDTYFND